MTNQIKTSIIALILLLAAATDLWAATATVTNNGNFTVRVQYKNPDGQYEDLAHLKPGETVEVPGGVEKVKIVRELGEWAQPLKPGQVLNVEVKEGDTVVGTMTWYGDKVFFDGLTEGPPPVSVTGPVTQPEPPKEEPKSEPKPEPIPEPKPQEGETPSAWPQYGGPWDYLFPFGLFLMWPFLILMWFRHLMRPRYHLGGEWVEGSRLGWGWGWYPRSEGGMPCGMFGLLIGLLFGLALGGTALWGYSQLENGHGFFPLFARDLYAFPYFLFSQLPWIIGGEPEVWSIFLFWVLLCTLCGGMGGLIPLRWLYGAPCIAAILPFFLLMRGCAGSTPFAFDGGYEGQLLYPPAFVSLLFLPMLFEIFLDIIDPYYEMDEEDVEEAEWSFLQFFRGNPWPLLAFLGIGLGCSSLGIAYGHGWGEINQFGLLALFYNLPLMLGLNFLSRDLAILLFWMILAGGLGWAFCRGASRFAFYSCLIPAFLALLFLTMGNYPQRQLSFYMQRAITAEIIREIAGRTREDHFGDQSGGRRTGTFGGFARDMQFEAGQPESREQERYSDWER